MGYTSGSPTNIFSSVYRVDNFPPLHVSKAVKESDKWKHAVLDSFENEAIQQFNDNLEFVDLYRMIEGKITYQELSEVAPHMKDIQSLLDGVGVPSFLRHYDIIGIIVNAIIGYYNNMQPKFHVTDTGEIAQNEFLRFKNESFQKVVLGIIENTVKLHLAENGLDENNKQFESQEEQQAYIQKIQQTIQQFTPQDTKSDTTKNFKTVGIRWGEATLDRDKELFNFLRMERSELKDQLVSGRCFRHYKIGFDSYTPETWSPKNTFFSREVESEEVHKGEYVGRLHILTPAEVVKRYYHEIDTDTQRKILGGNRDWKTFVGDGAYSGSLETAMHSNFNKQARVPFSGFMDYQFALGLQDETSIPMGLQTFFNEDGSTTETERFLPRMIGDAHGRYDFYATIIRDDFRHRKDLCQVTEVYFRAYEYWGYLTYQDEDGTYQTEEVTEDILKDFLKENNIKQTYKVSYKDVVTKFEPDTLQWVLRPVIYEGVKIQASNVTTPIYLYCRPCEHQIKGDSEFDRYLPVAGYIGKSTAKKIEPYQAKFNLCMNQVYSLLEKEVGIFFLMDTAMIPSEYDGWGDASEALMAMRNIAKETGILPIATSGDTLKNQTNFNQFSTYNLSYSQQIADRTRLAEFCQNKAYEVIGINPTMLQSPTKYQTEEGVKQNQEATFAQISEIYENFNNYVKSTYELHLSVAQYCQSNNKDLSLYYTKSDGSIAFLKESDPNFPLRRIGLIAAADSKKRKELETFKSYLLNTNTLASDTLEIAKLISSDEMSEAVSIAMEAKVRREEAESAAHQRGMEQMQTKAQLDEEQANKDWERTETSKQRDRENYIYREQIKSLGRAADVQSDKAGTDQINKASDIALKQTELNMKNQESIRDYQRAERKDMEEKDFKMEKLKLDAKALEERIKTRESNERIAIVNKN